MSDNQLDLDAIALDRAMAEGREVADRDLRLSVKAEVLNIRDSRDALRVAVLDPTKDDLALDLPGALKAIARALIDTDRALISITKLLTSED